MVEAFGLDKRIENYQGKRPIGLYRWDLECLLDVIDVALEDPVEYPDQDAEGYTNLDNLHRRLKDEYRTHFE